MKITMISAWLIFEMTGLVIGVVFFGTGNLYSLMAFGLVCAFGGYLLVRYILEKKPDQNTFDDINNIGRN